MNTPHEFRRILEQRRGARAVLQKQRAQLAERTVILEAAAENSRQAQALIHAVAQMTQSQLEYQLGELGTMAQAAIFPDPYRFGARFEISRKSGTVCQFYFERGGEQIDPLSAAGGGPVDVASWALRPAILPLTGARKTLWLDEPFRFLSREYQPRAAVMLREISHTLGLQIIMITHSPDLIQAADRLFRVVKGEDGRSQVITEENSDGAEKRLPHTGGSEAKHPKKKLTRSATGLVPLLRSPGDDRVEGQLVPPTRTRRRKP